MRPVFNANPPTAVLFEDTTDVNWTLPWDQQTNAPADPAGHVAQLLTAALAANNMSGPDAYVAQAPTPQETYAAALSTGITAVWSTSTALNGQYAIDQATQFNITAETVSILKNDTFTNGSGAVPWFDMLGAVKMMTVAQFAAFATAVGAYVSALTVAYGTALAGDNPSWPTSVLTVDA